MQQDLLSLAAARSGHFEFDSGYHGDLWLDLDRLFSRPSVLRPCVTELACRLAMHKFEVICGPLVGGALLAQMIAAELDVELCFTERDREAPSRYHLPAGVREMIRGKTVAVVDDAINAGSAVHATLAELRALGGKPVVIGALLALGAATTFCAGERLPLESISRPASHLWPKMQCPLCAAGMGLSGAAPA